MDVAKPGYELPRDISPGEISGRRHLTESGEGEIRHLVVKVTDPPLHVDIPHHTDACSYGCIAEGFRRVHEAGQDRIREMPEKDMS